MPHDEETIDNLYEAAAIPELWAALLDKFALRTKAHAAFLLVIDGLGQVQIASSKAGEDFAAAYATLGFAPGAKRLSGLLEKQEAGFVRSSQVWSEGERECEPVYAELLKPRGLGHGLSTVIRVPRGITIIVSVERLVVSGDFDDAAVARLNTLRPHFARAALLATRIGLNHTRAQTQILAQLGMAAAVIDTNCRIMTSNDLFDNVMPAIFRDRNDRIGLVEREPDLLMAAALKDITIGRSAVVSSFPIRTTGAPAVVHLIPVKRSGLGMFNHAAAVVVVTRVGDNALPSADLVEALFDLTPAEARLARALAQGTTPGDFATDHHVSPETVRTHLKRIFLKTGFNRQSDLVRAIVSLKTAIAIFVILGQPKLPDLSSALANYA